MFFERTNKAPGGLIDFIYKNSQKCKPEELKAGVDKVLIVLASEPTTIMEIIAKHPYEPGTFILDELADKMEMQGCLEKLGALYDNCLDDIIRVCIWNFYDLARCINKLPAPRYEEIVMNKILSDEARVKLILAADNDPAGTLKKLKEKYPKYENGFQACYILPESVNSKCTH